MLAEWLQQISHNSNIPCFSLTGDLCKLYFKLTPGNCDTLMTNQIPTDWLLLATVRDMISQYMTPWACVF